MMEKLLAEIAYAVLMFVLGGVTFAALFNSGCL